MHRDDQREPMLLLCRLFFSFIYPAYGTINALESVGGADDTQARSLVLMDNSSKLLLTFTS